MSTTINYCNDPVSRGVRSWIERVVVGLNLCPFATPLVSSNSIRIVVCRSHAVEDIAKFVVTELDLFSRSSELDISTSFLVFPDSLGDFADYLAFLNDLDTLLEEMGLRGQIQLASFHPDYLFDGEPIDSLSHFTNRSPYPLIHMLREDMVTRALEAYPSSELIPERNIQTLESLGARGIEKLFRTIDS